jgi:putative thioredoxin
MYVDATDSDFEQKVVVRSRETVVLVDYWADWCGPCLTLGPILEKLAAEPDAGFELVKVNVDQSPQSAAAMGVRGIPMVVAFKDGAPASSFTGAIPEADVRRFIGEVTGQGAARAAAKVEPILEAIDQGDLDRADELLRALRGDPDGAGNIDALEARLDLARYAADHAMTFHDDIDDPDQVLAREVHEALAGNHESAFEAILGVLTRSPEHKSAAHGLLLDILHLMEDDLARDLRRKLASALY